MNAANSSFASQPSKSISVAFGVWVAVLLVTLAIAAAVVVAPVAQATGHTAFASAIYKTFSFLCHQIPERSFHLAGHQFAVCSRCTGLYAGFALATLSYPVFRSLPRTDTPSIIWLFVSAVPLALDFGLTYFGIWQNNHFTRFTTGALFGAVAAIYVVPGVVEVAVTMSRLARRT